MIDFELSTSPFIAPSFLPRPARTSGNRLDVVAMDDQATQALVERQPHLKPLSNPTANATKQVLATLSATASIVPIPYMRSTIGMGMEVIEVCEAATSNKEQIKRLQEHVCQMLVVLAEFATTSLDKPDNLSPQMVRVFEGASSELRIIFETLSEMRKQAIIKSILLHQVNSSKILDCMERVQRIVVLLGISAQMSTQRSLRTIEVCVGDIRHHTAIATNRELDDLKFKLDLPHAGVSAGAKSATRRAVRTHEESGARRRRRRVNLPPKPSALQGREASIHEVSTRLTSDDTAHVCILGPGGIGKTTLALAAVHSSPIQTKFAPENRLWVSCSEATSPNLLLQVLYTSLDATRDTKDVLEDIVYEVHASQEPLLLVLDDFDTPWGGNEDNQRTISNILGRLGRLSHVALLVTMRGEQPPDCQDVFTWRVKTLSPLEEDDCRRIFEDIYPEAKDDPQLDQLLEALDFSPLAVTLMAQSGRASQATVGSLLQQWSQSKSYMLSPERIVDGSVDRSIELSLQSNLVRQDADALALLAILSLLPAGTTTGRLEWWAPSLASREATLNTLARAALVDVTVNKGDPDGMGSSQSSIIVLAPIRAYMLRNDRISEDIHQEVRQACCKYVLHHATRSGDVDFKRRAVALTAEDRNIQAVLISPADSEVKSPTRGEQLRWWIHTSRAERQSQREALELLIESLLAFSWFRNDTHPDEAIPAHTLKVARGSKNKALIAEALFCMGFTYCQLGEFERANAHYQEARSYFKSLSSASQIQKARCRRAECGLSLADGMRFLYRDADDILELLRDVQADFASLSDPDLAEFGVARCVVKFGVTHQYAGQNSRALEYLDHGKRLLEKFSAQKLEVAQCFCALSSAYYALGKYPEASEILTEASKLAEQLDDEYLRSDVAQSRGYLLARLGVYDAALQSANEALEINRNIGRHLSVAQTAELVGHVFLKQNKLADAYSAYEIAYKEYNRLGDNHLARLSSNQCRRNLAKIRQKQDNTDENVGFLVLTTDVDPEQLF